MLPNNTENDRAFMKKALLLLENGHVLFRHRHDHATIFSITSDDLDSIKDLHQVEQFQHLGEEVEIEVTRHHPSHGEMPSTMQVGHLERIEYFGPDNGVIYPNLFMAFRTTY
jgi:hypothetical protein